MPPQQQTSTELPYEFESSKDRTGDGFRKAITWFFDSIQVVVIALALFVVVYLWILSPHQVLGRSMMPNFLDKELLIADKITVNMNKLQRGDVIIFKFSESADHIKRIVGVPGDAVKVEGGRVYIDGELLAEDYLPEGRITQQGTYMKEGIEYTVPEGQFIVMGDNRQESWDSRAYGFMDPQSHTIKGRAWVVYWPFEQLRTIDRLEQ